MNRNINADSILSVLFETIEGVKNNNDPSASKNEKVSLEQAKAINELARTAVSVYKVKAEALKVIANSDNPQHTAVNVESTGLLDVYKE
ncbi:MAG: hypothetical protein IKW15_01440 [Bacteroidales bacterium]|nr:hypothetical protein [Bacteroidales bacterium]